MSYLKTDMVALWYCFQVQDVYGYIKSLHSCAAYADNFLQEEIDGQSLVLLKEDHLMNSMNIKLGPALKIVASIKQLMGDS